MFAYLSVIVSTLRRLVLTIRESSANKMADRTAQGVTVNREYTSLPPVYFLVIDLHLLSLTSFVIHDLLYCNILFL